MWIDVTFAIVAALGFYWGYSRGIIRAVISVAAIFVGFVLAVRFAEPTTEVLANLFNTSPTGAMPLLGFVVAFGVVLLLMRLTATGIERMLTAVRLNVLNKAAGGFAAAALSTLLFSILLTFINSANLIPIETKNQSITYRALEEFPDQAYAILGKAKPAVNTVREAGQRALEGKPEQEK